MLFFPHYIYYLVIKLDDRQCDHKYQYLQNDVTILYEKEGCLRPMEMLAMCRWAENWLVKQKEIRNMLINSNN